MFNCHNYVTSLLASELKAWLLYYSLPILVKVLPEKYVVHFALLVEGIHILLSDDISPTDLDVAETILDKFYEDFEPLYGKLHLHVKLTHTKILTLTEPESSLTPTKILLQEQNMSQLDMNRTCNFVQSSMREIEETKLISGLCPAKSGLMRH